MVRGDASPIKKYLLGTTGHEGNSAITIKNVGLSGARRLAHEVSCPSFPFYPRLCLCLCLTALQRDNVSRMPMKLSLSCLLVVLAACDPGSSGGGGGAGGGGGLNDGGIGDGGIGDGGVGDGGLRDGGSPGDGGLPGSDWSFVPIPGSKCALGAQAGIGYNPGASGQLVIFLQGGGACWNNGTCHPSLFQWGPVCSYGSDTICLFDEQGGTKPLASHVSAANPFPADGGGEFPSEISTVKTSLLFNRRPENPLGAASYVYVPYCTGDLHSGNTTRNYATKAGVFDPVVPLVHNFAGGTNMDAYLAYLRTRHPAVNTVWLTGISGGGFGASLNLKRVRLAFPEATVHLLADSAPMVQPAHFEAWKTEWKMQLPAGCSACDAGLPTVIQYMIDDAPASRVALLAYSEDQVITRFAYSGGNTDSWVNPPYGTYTSNLVLLENRYDATPNAKYFRLPGRDHVMLQQYGIVQSDGGISRPVASRDGGTDLKAWVDAWATGGGSWQSHK